MPIAVMNISDAEADALLDIEESHFVDLKAIDVSGASVSKAVCAFSNTSGGELYIGVDEELSLAGLERKWRGFANQESANHVFQVLERMFPIGNYYSATFLSTDSHAGLVLHLTVQKAREVLRASDGKVYVRRGAQKLPLASDEAIRRLEYDKGISTFEDERLQVEHSVVTNSTRIIEFLLSVIPTAEPKAWLEKQRLLVDGRPSVAGALLFADEPQALLPKRSAIKIFRYKTRSEGERDLLVFDPLTVEGPLYELIYAAVAKTADVVEGIEKLGPSGLEKIVYPTDALHEIVTNAVLHRDYSIPVDIQVRVFDNRIEVESPGRLPGHITVDNILTEQFARNPKIVRIINKFPDPPNKDVGEGLNTAFESMEKLRLKAPVIEERDNSLVVVLKHESLGSPEQLVMDYLNTHSEITNSVARELTGIRSENSMKEVFYRLKERNLLEPVPGKLGRNAAWKKRDVE